MEAMNHPAEEQLVRMLMEEMGDELDMAYKEEFSVTVNRIGTIDCDSVKGCWGSCYGGACYALQTAQRFGWDFHDPKVRYFEESEREKFTNQIKKAAKDEKKSWARVGVMGDPSLSWSNTARVCELIRGAGLAPVVISKHRRIATPKNFQDMIEQGTILHTSICFLDGIVWKRRYEQAMRYAKMGGKSLVRLVTYEAKDSEMAEMKRIIDTCPLPILETPLRLKKTNPLVESGRVLNPNRTIQLTDRVCAAEPPFDCRKCKMQRGVDWRFPKMKKDEVAPDEITKPDRVASMQEAVERGVKPFRFFNQLKGIDGRGGKDSYSVDGLKDTLLIEDYPYAVEQKFGGTRIQIHKQGDTVKVYSMAGDTLTSCVPGIIEDLKGVKHDMVLDAELVGQEGENAQPVAHVFDILYFGSKALHRMTLSVRRKALETLPSNLHHVRVTPARLVDNWNELRRAVAWASASDGSEGVVMKSLVSSYPLTGTTTKWIDFQDDETPYFLTRKAVGLGDMPPMGTSWVPQEARKRIPAKYRYWKHDDQAKAKEIRDALVDAIRNREVTLDAIEDLPDEGYFLLTEICWRGPNRKADGCSRKENVLFLQTGQRRLMMFLDGNPIELPKVAAVIGEAVHKYWAHLSGKVPYQSVLNPTMDTPANQTRLAQGKFIIKEKDATRLRLSFSSDKFKGEFLLRRTRPKTSLWVFERAPDA